MRRPDWDCWPDLRVTIRPLPWTWALRPRLYADANGARSHSSVAWLCVVVEWYGQDLGHSLFPMAEASAGSATPTGDDRG
jgi:hypothetical protein